MSLLTFIFNHKEWEDLYRNCSYKSVEKWNSDGTSNMAIGILYTVIGIVCEIVYVPFLIVMARKEFIQHSCYKMMFLLGIIDLIVIPCNSIIGGIQCARGAHFCSNPEFYFLIGKISTAGWYGGSMTCVLLAFNRLCEMIFPTMARKIFGGNLVYLWLAIPVVYMIYGFNELPLLYNNILFAYFFDPFIGDEKLQNPVVITIQSVCICVEMIIAAIIYVIMQFVKISDVFVVIAHTCWICVHGDTPIVYLALNKSLSKSVFKLLANLKRSNRISSNPAVVSRIVTPK